MFFLGYRSASQPIIKRPIMLAPSTRDIIFAASPLRIFQINTEKQFQVLT